MFNFALQILAKFSLFRDVAKMYLKVDEKSIKPGLVLVNDVGSIEGKPGMTDDQLFEMRKKKMLDYATEAKATVTAVVKEVSAHLRGQADLVLKYLGMQQQGIIISTLQSRIDDLGKSIAVFPLEYQPDKKTTEAIEGGAALIKAGNEEQIDESLNQSTVTRVMTQSTLVSLNP